MWYCMVQSESKLSAKLYDHSGQHNFGLLLAGTSKNSNM